MEGQEKKVINGKEFKEPGVMIGDYVCIRGGVSEEALKEAKEDLLNKITEEIRRVAEQKPAEFFIIKKHLPIGPLDEDCYTVGCKIILPTVSDCTAE